MANWKSVLDIKELHEKAQDDQISPEILGKCVAEKLRENKFKHQPEIQDIIYQLENEINDFDDYDMIMDHLYDFGNNKHRIWVKTF